MGCAGALPALQRGFDYVKGDCEKTALVVTVEVCSACCYIDDKLETVVGNAICGDGAASVVLRGAPSRNHGPSILGFQVFIDTDFMDAVGLENVDGRHRIVLSKEIRKAAGPAVAKVVDRLLARFGIDRKCVSHWIFHAGGAAVITNIEQAMGFSDRELRWSRSVFRQHGNMSSPTALFVLNEFQRHERPQSGDLGVVLALGPGLATEAALLQW
jgi:predicted naringenin-chalcone synthase